MAIQKLKHKLSTISSDDLMFYSVALTFFLLPTGTAPPLISIGLGCLIWIFSGKIFQIKSIIKQPWFYPVIPFLILPWTGLLYSQNLELGMDYAMKTKYWLALFLTAGMALNHKRFDVIIKLFWAGLFIGAVLALVQFVGMTPPIREGFLGYGVVHTLADMYLIIGILTVSFYFKKSDSFQFRTFMILLLLSFLFHLAVLRGRSGYLIFGICTPFIALNLMEKFSLKIKVGVSVILVCTLFLSPVVRGVINDTFVGLQQEKVKILRGEDSARFPRFFIVRESIKIILAHPIIGIGTGSIADVTKAKGHIVEHPHNNFLHMGTSFGLFGIAAFFLFFWKIFWCSWKHRDTAVGYFVFSSCLVLFLGGMFDTQMLNTGTLLLLSLTYGFLNHLEKSTELILENGV